ncbi:MAG: GUN4 domain-containing protein [Dolichospermum sp.]
MGKNPKVINEINEPDTHNLEILEEEEQLKSFDIDISNLPRRYKLNNKDFDALCQFLITVHTLFAGWIIDIHYLIYHDVTPLLPQLLPKFIEDGLETQIIDTIVSGYQGVYQSFENDRSAWIPELVLDLAHSLSHLPDKYWAREQLNYSVRYWLQLRGVIANNNLLEATRSVLTFQDREYFEKLKECFARLEDTEGVTKAASLLSETVERQKKADDFYNGGIYHLQNGNYERSLADFEEAQRYGHSDASRMIVEVKRRQQQELKSSVGIDYTKLQNYLKAGNWKEADEETLRVILAVVKREEELDKESIDNFPCEDLRTIDQLWVKYSKGRFGFSVQKRIYQSLGGTREYNEKIWQAFGDRVGWRKGGSWLRYHDITFDIKAQAGHLPCLKYSWFWKLSLREGGGFLGGDVGVCWWYGVPLLSRRDL